MIKQNVNYQIVRLKEDYYIADNGAKCEPMEGTEEETNSSVAPFSRVNIVYTLVFLALFL